MNDSKKNIEIKVSTLQDSSSILSLYASAIALQKEKNAVPWGRIDKTQIEKEINEERQFKMTIEGEIAVVWVYTFSDPEIWKERDMNNALYIHRIATHPKFRGQNLVNAVLAFSRKYAKKRKLQFMRLDTAGYNEGLIHHYTNNGFSYLGTTRIENTENLPSHYRDVDVCLFEEKLNYGFFNFFSIAVEGAESMSKFR